MPSMNMFLRVAAIFVGLANIYIIGILGGAPAVPTRIASSPTLLLTTVLYAVISGLVASEITLRSMRSALRGSFFLRYIAMVLTVCIGGMIFGSLVPLGTLFDNSLTTTDRLTVTIVGGIVGTLFGGVLGAIEGLIIAFPLAAILGMFRNEE